MLIDSRDAERLIGPTALVSLSRPEKEELLDDLAYWMLRNGYSEAPLAEVVARIEQPLARLGRVAHPAAEVVHELLERSGVLRQPSLGMVDFVHRTFMEYMAARGAVQAADLGVLVDRAREESWRETIVFAAGHAKGEKRDKLIDSLLKKPWFGLRERPLEADVTAACCLETARTSLRPDLLARLQDCANHLFPPRDVSMARLLAPAASLDPKRLLGHAQRGSEVVAACVRCAAAVGGAAMLEVIESYAAIDAGAVRSELLNAWTVFDEQEFLERVVKRQRWPGTEQFAASAIADADLYRCMLVLAQTGDFSGKTEELAKALHDFGEAHRLSVGRINLSAAKHLSQIKSLEHLLCTHLEAGTLECLAKLPRLVRLAAPLGASSQEQAQALARLPALVQLTLSGLDQERAQSEAVVDLRGLQACPALSELEVKHVGSKSLLLPLSSRLRGLVLAYTPSDDLIRLGQAGELLELSLQFKVWPDIGVRLGGLKRLQTLNVYVDMNEPVSLNLPPALEQLRLSNCSQAQLRGVESLGALTHLSLVSVGERAPWDALLARPSLSSIYWSGAAPSEVMARALLAARERGVHVSGLPEPVPP